MNATQIHANSTPTPHTSSHTQCFNFVACEQCPSNNFLKTPYPNLTRRSPCVLCYCSHDFGAWNETTWSERVPDATRVKVQASARYTGDAQRGRHHIGGLHYSTVILDILGETYFEADYLWVPRVWISILRGTYPRGCLTVDVRHSACYKPTTMSDQATDTETFAKDEVQTPATPSDPPAFPEGGLRAWLTVAGGCVPRDEACSWYLSLIQMDGCILHVWQDYSQWV
jgi:hypothetical protein